MLRYLDIGLIRARADARVLDTEKVSAIADSIAAVDMINPVRVRERDGVYELIAGNHRLAACKALGLTDIAAFIVQDDDLKAELAMIDENLCRAELGPMDRARQTARRKELYETLHGKAKAKGAHAAHEAMGHQHDATAKFADAFTADTAKATGESERLVRLNAERGARVIDEVAELIRGTVLDTGVYIDGLKRLPPNDQITVARRDLARARQLAEEKAKARIADKKERRAEREAALGARQQALPEKRYGVILADPEWSFETWSEAGMDRAADNHYPTSPLEAIKARDVPSIAADDCALLLWATVPMHHLAYEVVRAWGFEPKTEFVWLKDVAGTGYWNRNQHEILILATKGRVPCPAPGDQFRSALAWPVGAHSEKPPFAHEIAEAYFPSLPKIELNARARRDGWEAWGLEAPEAEPQGNLSGGEISAHQGHESYARMAEAPVLNAPDEPAIAEGFSPKPSASLSEVAVVSRNGSRLAGVPLTRETAGPVLRARYATTPGAALAAELGVNVNTLRAWARFHGLASVDRRTQQLIERNRARKGVSHA